MKRVPWGLLAIVGAVGLLLAYIIAKVNESSEKVANLPRDLGEAAEDTWEEFTGTLEEELAILGEWAKGFGAWALGRRTHELDPSSVSSGDTEDTYGGPSYYEDDRDPFDAIPGADY